MNEIADVIQKNPHIKKIAIEGHASAEGNKQYNKTLSDKRAKAVMKYLVEKGIAQEMLTASGFGSEKPIAENETEEGREKNRRVEFNIVEQDITKKKVEIDSKGSEKVLSEEKAVEKKEEPPPAPEPEKDPKKKTPKKAPAPAPKTPEANP
jgi:OOP family OmpA-OmpF porin